MLISNVAIAQRIYSFKGIPVRGLIEKFADSLKSYNFDVSVEEAFLGNYYNIKGICFGEECKLELVEADADYDFIAGVLVLTPEQDTWEKTFSKYNEFKKMFTELYGKPYTKLETVGPNNPKNGIDIYRSIRNSEAAFISCFHDDQGGGAEGTVTLSIAVKEELFGDPKGYLKIEYLNNKVVPIGYSVDRDLLPK